MFLYTLSTCFLELEQVRKIQVRYILCLFFLLIKRRQKITGASFRTCYRVAGSLKMVHLSNFAFNWNKQFNFWLIISIYWIKFKNWYKNHICYQNIFEWIRKLTNREILKVWIRSDHKIDGQGRWMEFFSLWRWWVQLHGTILKVCIWMEKVRFSHQASLRKVKGVFGRKSLYIKYIRWNARLCAQLTCFISLKDADVACTSCVYPWYTFLANFQHGKSEFKGSKKLVSYIFNYNFYNCIIFGYYFYLCNIFPLLHKLIDGVIKIDTTRIFMKKCFLYF